jgi:NADH-quinone oxidoreductase subunit M
VGAFRVNSWLAIVAATGALLSAAYMLYMYRRVVFGELVKPALQGLKDLSLREWALLAPLAVVALLMGFYPKPVFDVTGAAVSHLIQRQAQGVAAVGTPQISAARPFDRLSFNRENLR